MTSDFIYDGKKQKLLKEKRGGFIFYWAISYHHWYENMNMFGTRSMVPIRIKDVVQDLFNCENIAGAFRWYERQEILKSYFGDDERLWPNVEV